MSTNVNNLLKNMCVMVISQNLSTRCECAGTVCPPLTLFHFVWVSFEAKMLFLLHCLGHLKRGMFCFSVRVLGITPLHTCSHCPVAKSERLTERLAFKEGLW